jgi:hypothetical protein
MARHTDFQSLLRAFKALEGSNDGGVTYKKVWKVPAAESFTVTLHNGASDYAISFVENPSGIYYAVSCMTPPDSPAGSGLMWTDGRGEVEDPFKALSDAIMSVNCDITRKMLAPVLLRIYDALHHCSNEEAS